MPFEFYIAIWFVWKVSSVFEMELNRIASMVSTHSAGMLQIKRSNKSFECHLIIYSFHFFLVPSSSSFHPSFWNFLSNLCKLKKALRDSVAMVQCNVSRLEGVTSDSHSTLCYILVRLLFSIYFTWHIQRGILMKKNNEPVDEFLVLFHSSTFTENAMQCKWIEMQQRFGKMRVWNIYENGKVELFPNEPRNCTNLSLAFSLVHPSKVSTVCHHN